MERQTSITTSIEDRQNQTRTTQTQTRHTTTATTTRSSLYGAPSRTVRTNWIYYLRASWQRISRTSKVILGTTLLIGFAQIVITIVMLTIGRNEQCDRPLDIYLIVFLIRLSFSLPLLIYQHLRPLHSDGGNINSAATMAAATVAAAATPATTTTTAAAATPSSSHSNTSTSADSSTTTTANTSSSTSSPSPSNNSISVTSISHEATSVAQTHPTVTNTHTESSSSSRPIIPTRGFLDRTKSFLDLISILWFVVGNYLIFTAPDQCHRDANHLFYTTLAWILLGYFLVLIPLLLCATVVFCLPCLLVTMRTMNVDYATGMVGANKNEIQSIPVYKYKTNSSPITTTLDNSSEQHQNSQHPEQQTSQEALSSPASSTSPDVASTATAAKKKKKSLLVRMFSIPSHNKNSLHDEETAAEFTEWTMDDPNDASCTICLSDYENDDLVCKLRCNHHFHRDCVHEWLALNFKFHYIKGIFVVKRRKVAMTILIDYQAYKSH